MDHHLDPGQPAAQVRPVPATMMALRAHARGGAEQPVFEQAPVPVAGPDEALVEVHAAAITFAEPTCDLTWTTQDGTVPAAAAGDARRPAVGAAR